MSQNLQLVAGRLARSCYPADPQTLYNEMFARGSALLPDITGIVMSDTAPGADDRDKGWVKTNAGAPVWTGIFIWFNGKWVSPHPCPPSGSERRLWVGADVDLITYDGGSVGAVSDASGPMWEIDTAFAGRTAFGPGTTAGGTVIGVATNGGADQVTLSQANLPNVNFVLTVKKAQADGLDTDTNEVICDPTSSYNSGTLNVPSGGSGTAFNIVPPFRGAYFIKRTARIYVVGA